MRLALAMVLAAACSSNPPPAAPVTPAPAPAAPVAEPPADHHDDVPPAEGPVAVDPGIKSRDLDVDPDRRDPSPSTGIGSLDTQRTKPGGLGGHVTPPRSNPVPTVGIGQPNASGDLDKAIIRRYIKRNIQKIQYCYEKTLLAKPGLAGTVTISFTIGVDGKVSSSAGAGVDPDVASCVAGVIKDIEFPKPKGGGVVNVNYPFVFAPASP